MGSVDWRPTSIRRFIRGFPTSSRTALVSTDAGLGYLKALGGPEGPHTLAAELVGTELARWIGLPTFDYAIVQVEAVDEVPFFDRRGKREGQALPGPAFISRQERGEAWGGGDEQLALLANPGDITRLVILDTWLLNCDRHAFPASRPLKPRVNRDNVFLSSEAPPGRFVLKAMDHTHCFTCGREWTAKLGRVDTIKEPSVFGLFPEFKAFLDKAVAVQAIARLRQLTEADVSPILKTIPRAWMVPQTTANALKNLIVGRAAFVADTILDRLWPQRQMFADDAIPEEGA